MSGKRKIKGTKKKPSSVGIRKGVSGGIKSKIECEHLKQSASGRHFNQGYMGELDHEMLLHGNDR
jgi:hypothetical protein